MKTLFVYDLDGNVCDAEWRTTLAGPEPSKDNRKRYKQWLKRVQSKKMLMKDLPVRGMLELVKATKKNAIYLTSRSETFRTVSAKWLKKHKFPGLKLYMRGKNDWKSSGKFKESVILSIIKQKKINVVIFDDDPRGDIFEAAKRNGWTFLKNLSGS
jgi:uncharacterized HAD superfamily protein